MVQAFKFETSLPRKDIKEFERVTVKNDESIKNLDEVFERVSHLQPYGGGEKCEIDRRMELDAIYSLFLLDNRSIC